MPSENVDPRLGPLRVEFLSVQLNGSMNFPSKQAENTFAKFEKVDSFQTDPADELYGDEKTVVDVPFGIVHLFRNLREATTEDKPSTSSAESTMSDEDIGTILAMINVSSSMSTSRLLSFVGPALATMQHVRLIQYVNNANKQSNTERSSFDVDEIL